MEGSGTGENSWRRLLLVSATHMFPAASKANPLGHWNCPGPLPTLPNWPRYAPLTLNSTMRLLLVSATQRLPTESKARASGPFNCPLPLPELPNC